MTSGRIDVRDIAGGLRLRTTAGAMRMTGVSGAVWARSLSGTITGAALTAPTADVAVTSGAVRLSGRRVPRRLLAVLLVIALVATGTAWFLLRGKDAVVNGSAGVDTRGWEATSDAGKIRVWRFSVDDGPDGAQSAVDLRRGPGSGTWAMALATLRSPDR